MVQASTGSFLSHFLAIAARLVSFFLLDLAGASGSAVQVDVPERGYCTRAVAVEILGRCGEKPTTADLRNQLFQQPEVSIGAFVKYMEAKGFEAEIYQLNPESSLFLEQRLRAIGRGHQFAVLRTPNSSIASQAGHVTLIERCSAKSMTLYDPSNGEMLDIDWRKLGAATDSAQVIFLSKQEDANHSYAYQSSILEWVGLGIAFVGLCLLTRLWRISRCKAMVLPTALLVSVCGCARESSIDETMAVEPRRLVFNKVWHGTTNTRELKVINESENPITDLRVGSSCGCTVPTLTQKTLNAGEELKIDVTFEALRVGSGEESVMIDGVVSGEAFSERVVLEYTIVPSLKIRPETEVLGDVSLSGSEQLLEFQIDDPQGELQAEGLKSIRLSAKANSRLNYQLVDPDMTVHDEAEILVLVEIPEQSFGGGFADEIIIKLDGADDNSRSYSVWVSGRLVD